MEPRSSDSSKLMRIDEVDPMRRREEYAVSLRKQKKKLIIERKRKRLPSSILQGQSKSAANTNMGSALSYDQSM